MISDKVLLIVPSDIYFKAAEEALANCRDTHEQILCDFQEFINNKKREEDSIYSEIARLKKVQSDFISGIFKI